MPPHAAPTCSTQQDHNHERQAEADEVERQHRVAERQRDPGGCLQSRLPARLCAPTRALTPPRGPAPVLPKMTASSAGSQGTARESAGNRRNDQGWESLPMRTMAMNGAANMRAYRGRAGDCGGQVAEQDQPLERSTWMRASWVGEMTSGRLFPRVVFSRTRDESSHER